MNTVIPKKWCFHFEEVENSREKHMQNQPFFVHCREGNFIIIVEPLFKIYKLEDSPFPAMDYVSPGGVAHNLNVSGFKSSKLHTFNGEFEYIYTRFAEPELKIITDHFVKVVHIDKRLDNISIDGDKFGLDRRGTPLIISIASDGTVSKINSSEDRYGYPIAVLVQDPRLFYEIVYNNSPHGPAEK